MTKASFQLRNAVMFAFVLTLAWAAAFLSAPSFASEPAPRDAIDRMIDDAKDAMLKDPNIATAKAVEIEQLLARRPDSSHHVEQLAMVQWLQGQAALRLGHPERAQGYINHAFSLVGPQTAPSKLKGDLYLTRGNIHMASAEVASALADFQDAFRVFRKIGDVRNQAIALLDIAWLYQEANNYQSALKYYGQAFDLYRGDPKLSMSIYNNLGTTLKELGRFDEAQKQFGAGLKIARELNSPVVEAQILRNMARGSLAAGDLAAANRASNESLRISTVLGGSSMAQALSLAAQVAYQRGDYSQAERLLDRAFAGMDVNETTLPFREAHQTAVLVYTALHQDGRALSHLQALKRLDDETAKLAASANTALLAAQFDSANQQLKITKLEKAEAQRTLELERSRAQFQRILFSGIAIATLIGVGMLAFGLVTIRRSRNEVRAANIDLAATNDALEKALAAKTEFLATTSHEIRTPLNGILGMTQVMLADRALTAETRDRLSVVHGAGVTMRALVDDILDVAKMESGNMALEQVPFDLAATLTDVARMWRDQATAKGIGFDLDLGACPTMVEGDPARLRQVVFNLLSNALKFTSHGSIGLKAQAEHGRLWIIVSDTGIGIPADKHEVIFESFRQVDTSTTRKFGGTGLGLAICRNLARAMGGDILVDSTPGEGTRFTVDLPYVAAEAPAPVAAEGAGAMLVIDRNPITRSMLKALFAPRVGTVEAAGTIGDSLPLLAKGGFGWVLIDESVVKEEADQIAALAPLVEATHAGGARLAMLWPALSDEKRTDLSAAGIDLPIAKPIAGAALTEMIYPADGANKSVQANPDLVSRAA